MLSNTYLLDNGVKLLYPCLFLLFLSNNLFAKTDRYRCMWKEDPSTTMVIAWDQVSGQQPVVYYDEFDGGRDPNLYAYSQQPDYQTSFKGMNNQFVRLRGLHPGTVYYFIIADSDGVSQRMSFRTAPDHPYERISIIAGGDSRNFRDARRRANKMVAKLQPHCVLFGGDMTGGDSAREWIDWFNDWQYTISDEGRLIPVLATRGNHEYSNETIVKLFDVPNKEVYYNMSIGGNLLQIYTLNSLIAAGGNQRFWLQNELQKSNHIWKMAQYHYGIRPHHNRKSERNTQLYNWAPLFDDYAVNLVVESDAHVVKTTWPIRPSKEAGSEEGFIRDDENGTVYVGEGCWGAPLRKNNDDKSWTRNSGSFNQFKWIFIDTEKMEVRTVKTDNAKSVAAVSPYDIFTPPPGIDLWKPSNGAVLTIYPRQAMPYNVVSTGSCHPQNVANWTASSNQVMGTIDAPENSATKAIAVARALTVNDFTVDYQHGETSIRWYTQDEYNPRTVYELQRSKDGKTFRTIAEVSAQGNGGGQYKIEDNASAHDHGEGLSYRLRYISRGKAIYVNPKHNKHKTTTVIKNHPWRAFPELRPNQDTEQLQVNYQLKESGTVSIQLLDEKEKEVALSHYPNKKSGNYSKTIDMAIFPKGLYLLIIKVNEDQISQYQVVWK